MLGHVTQNPKVNEIRGLTLSFDSFHFPSMRDLVYKKN